MEAKKSLKTRADLIMGEKAMAATMMSTHDKFNLKNRKEIKRVNDSKLSALSKSNIGSPSHLSRRGSI
jgi:hypothetical protein